MNSFYNQLASINQRLKSQDEKYLAQKPLRIFCGTFNLNGKMADEDLKSWLCINIGNKPIDIYAIGFQELIDLNTKNLLIQSDAYERELYWINVLDNIIMKDNKLKFKQLAKVRMFGLFLIIYANSALIEKDRIKDIYTSSIATGIMDIVGNKGSVGVSMKIYENRVCFVCSHFAADTDKVEKRNSDFRSTKQKLRFNNDPNDLNSYYDLENDHDAIFWFGDLNYRLDQIPLNETFRLIQAKEFNDLLKYDQLTNQRINFKVFENYSEGN